MSHRPCLAGMAATAVHRASTAVLMGSPASGDQVQPRWRWRARGWAACRAGVPRSPVGWVTLILALMPSFMWHLY